MKKKVQRSITINKTMEDDIFACCFFHGWTISRWIEEAMKFQIMADKKAIAKAQAAKMKPEQVDWANMSEEDLKKWTEAIDKENRERRCIQIARTPWAK